MQAKTLPTATARLHLSGPVEVAKQIIRAECLREGLCVTVEPSTFIYTGGEEAGYVVGLVDYPRFPWGQEKLTARARDLMRKLLDGTHQHSALMVTPELTEWITKREPDIAGVAPVEAPSERYCLACQKEGHRTDECHSTHSLNTPAARELFRLVHFAYDTRTRGVSASDGETIGRHAPGAST